MTKFSLFQLEWICRRPKKDDSKIEIRFEKDRKCGNRRKR